MSVRVVRVDGSNLHSVTGYLSEDIVKHVFAYYDLQYDFDHTSMHIVLRDGKIAGYILTYTGADVPSVVLECEKNVASSLVSYLPKDHFIVHTSLDMLGVLKSKFPSAKDYKEDWMLVTRDEAVFFPSDKVKRLRTKKHAEKLAALIFKKRDRPRDSLKNYFDWIRKKPVYGVFKGGELVAYAGSFLQLPQVWMIGGVYTAPEHRNKGCALEATSAMTKEALENADAAELFVRSDNFPAIKVYEKIGYRKIGERLWLDVGLGLKP